MFEKVCCPYPYMAAGLGITILMGVHYFPKKSVAVSHCFLSSNDVWKNLVSVICIMLSLYFSEI